LQLVSPLRVHAADQGRLAMEIGGGRNAFREVTPFLWEEEHGKRRVQAIVENGKIKRWGLEPYVFAFVFEPVPFMASTPVLVLLVGALCVALATVLVWPVTAWMRRRHGLARPALPLTLVRAASALVLVSVVVWVVTVAATEGGDPATLLALAQATSFLAFIGGLAAALWHARISFAGGNKGAMALSALWVLSFAVLVAIGWHHNLLSFNPQY
jgi:hypothetical protein